MNIFEKLKNGEPVDMMSEEYLPAIAELQRADKALFHRGYQVLTAIWRHHARTVRLEKVLRSEAAMHRLIRTT